MDATPLEIYSDNQVVFIVKTIGYYYFPGMAHQLLVNNKCAIRFICKIINKVEN